MEEIKEKYISDSIEPISINSTEIILNQMKKCVCKIHIKGIKGTGFFAKIPYKNNFISCLLTNNHVLGEDNIQDGNSISISLNNEEIFRNIKIDSKRKRYTNEILDVTIIEINEDIDNIKDFLILDNQILNKYNSYNDENNINYFRDIYEKESIYLLNYINGKEMFASYGLLSNIEENKIKHKCNTDTGSSGSPILLLKSNKVIGIHYGSSSHNFSFNFGTLILKPILEFQKISNNLLVIKKNNKNNIKKNISIVGGENKIKNKNNNVIEKKNKVGDDNDWEFIPTVEFEKIEYTEKFENFVANIIKKNEVDNEDIEEFNKLAQKYPGFFMYADEYLNKYLQSDNKDGISAISAEKFVKIKAKIFDALFKIQQELVSDKEKRIEKFRNDYSISDKDANDNEISRLLIIHNNNEQKVYEEILNNIIK